MTTEFDKLAQFCEGQGLEFSYWQDDQYYHLKVEFPDMVFRRSFTDPNDDWTEMECKEMLRDVNMHLLKSKKGP